jgi:hypothetical protein
MTILTDPIAINVFRLKTLAVGLRLEVGGLKKRGRSCFAIAKEELNVRGDKQRVLELLEEKIKGMEDGLASTKNA